jgi:hypothetical protein
LLDEFLDGSNSDELFISPIANIYNNIGNNINNTVQCSRTIEPITPEIIPKEKIIATTTLNFPMCIKT